MVKSDQATQILGYRRFRDRILVRDGIDLSAIVYVPTVESKPRPAILVMTPYIADSHHERAAYFASNGLPCVIVDERGRGDSGGIFRPFLNSAFDAHDTVDWLCKQSFCNGQIGMYGGSALGHAQWAAARTHPTNLETITPTAAPFAGLDFPHSNNIASLYSVQWLAFTAGKSRQMKFFEDRSFWIALFRKWHASGRPLAELDEMAGEPSSAFQEWMAHDHMDEYWDALNPSENEYAGIDIPVLTITGAYDGNQAGALEHYCRHTQAASESGSKHYLIIGPWDHSGTMKPAERFGGLEFGPASRIDIMRLHLEWFRWAMDGAHRPEFLTKKVVYYTAGAEEWRHADSLAEVTEDYLALQFQSSGTASDIYGGGKLTNERGSGDPDPYVYDPCGLDFDVFTALSDASDNWLADQGLVYALNGRSLTYHTSPLVEDLDISGFFKARLWLSINCPDTDFYVTTYEIDRRGASTRLSGASLRARFRDGKRSEKLIETADPLCYEFANFNFISRIIRRGHRLRLTISPVGWTTVMFQQKNYNSGGKPSYETIEDGRPVIVSLHHNGAHDSTVYIPIGRRSSSQ